MSEHFAASTSLSTEVCCQCGIVFAMPTDFQRRRRNDSQLFYCPAGHGQHYTGPTETEKLRLENERQKQMLEAERARAARAQQERDQISKAHNRMRARVFNGVCPCCNRTFQNLMQHMHQEHAGELNLKMMREAFGMTQGAVAREIGVTPVYISNAENGRPVPSYAQKAIGDWMARNGAKETTP